MALEKLPTTIENMYATVTVHSSEGGRVDHRVIAEPLVDTVTATDERPIEELQPTLRALIALAIPGPEVVQLVVSDGKGGSNLHNILAAPLIDL